MKSFLRNIEWGFILKFIGLLLFFYYFNIFFLGITTPGGSYNKWLADHLNYIQWLSNSILYASNAIVKASGLNSFIQGTASIKVVDGARVTLGWPCLGLGNIAFWAAFVLAHRTKAKSAIIWLTTGFGAIWFINCIRIAFILITLEKGIDIEDYIDNHDLFNYVCYGLIIFLMWLYHHNQQRNERRAEGDESSANTPLVLRSNTTREKLPSNIYTTD